MEPADNAEEKIGKANLPVKATIIFHPSVTHTPHHGIDFVGVREMPVEITLHLPFTHPHRPAPQSMGPWQTSVQSKVQTPLFALLMQLVGWQHSAGTQSFSLVQDCGPGGVVIMLGTVVTSGDVGAGDTVAGGVPEVHPHTMISPARNRSISKPG